MPRVADSHAASRMHRQSRKPDSPTLEAAVAEVGEEALHTPSACDHETLVCFSSRVPIKSAGSHALASGTLTIEEAAAARGHVNVLSAKSFYSTSMRQIALMLVCLLAHLLRPGCAICHIDKERSAAIWLAIKGPGGYELEVIWPRGGTQTVHQSLLEAENAVDLTLAAYYNAQATQFLGVRMLARYVTCTSRLRIMC